MTLYFHCEKVFIDPSSVAYYGDRLFDRNDVVLNRDSTLEPFIRLKGYLSRKGIDLHTADLLINYTRQVDKADYYSLGVLDNYKKLSMSVNVNLRAFVIFEPPVVDPRLYAALPQLTEIFERVYVHNIHGDGYSLDGVDISRLRKLHWPQPRNDVLENFWYKENRANRIVVINGNHRPRRRFNELYSKRIEAMVELAEFDSIDLYGRGWSRWWTSSSLWLPYWKNRAALLSIYKGECNSKFEVLSQYRFCLCFENMAMQGYLTEKLFDCLYVGTIPIYLGATDIAELIPSECYIDSRNFASWSALWDYVRNISEGEYARMKNAGRKFLNSPEYNIYFDSLEAIFNDQ